MYGGRRREWGVVGESGDWGVGETVAVGNIARTEKGGGRGFFAKGKKNPRWGKGLGAGRFVNHQCGGKTTNMNDMDG